MDINGGKASIYYHYADFCEETADHLMNWQPLMCVQLNINLEIIMK